jgi:hypothetical protein
MFNPPGAGQQFPKGQNLPGRHAFIPDASVVLLSDSPSPVEFDGFSVDHPSERSHGPKNRIGSH